ncbi:hypothetical protein EVAR_12489_1 [Eumeta japonica]|uniref:Uncharacterized protein n=1 Tax=Eumeta variegata TaxID=151549 RepID=A0A4C1TPL6_EUMVA|nr:hypothetical protein EVAR_12489_1 [Eumeta japonica]
MPSLCWATSHQQCNDKIQMYERQWNLTADVKCNCVNTNSPRGSRHVTARGKRGSKFVHSAPLLAYAPTNHFDRVHDPPTAGSVREMNGNQEK